MNRLNFLVSAAAFGVSALPAAAGQMALQVELPRLPVAEYHRPYVALWVQKADGSPAATLQVWYETEREEHGRRYLKELTQWWRKTGREMTFPADGVSGATRAPGPQTIAFDTAKGPLASLPPGQYQFVVEASREQGGHDIVKLPFSWPARAGATASARGESELGAVKLSVR